MTFLYGAFSNLTSDICCLRFLFHVIFCLSVICFKDLSVICFKESYKYNFGSFTLCKSEIETYCDVAFVSITMDVKIIRIKLKQHHYWSVSQGIKLLLFLLRQMFLASNWRTECKRKQIVKPLTFSVIFQNFYYSANGLQCCQGVECFMTLFNLLMRQNV